MTNSHVTADHNPPPVGPSPKKSKMQLMREALAEVGDRADIDTIGAWVRERSGVEISRNLISQYRSYITRAARDRNGEPRLINRHLIREALATLGRDSTPAEIAEWVRDNYGKSVPIQTVYNMRWQYPEAVMPPGGATVVDDLATLRRMLARYTGDELKSLIDMLGYWVQRG